MRLSCPQSPPPYFISSLSSRRRFSLNVRYVRGFLSPNADSGRNPSGPWLLFVSESGFGKRVPLSSFRLSPLNRVGLKGYKFSLEDRLAAVFVVGFSLADDRESDEHIVLVSQSGTVNRIKVRDISIQSRYARGVILMRLEYAGKIQSASLISATEPELEEEVEAAVA